MSGRRLKDAILERYLAGALTGAALAQVEGALAASEAGPNGRIPAGFPVCVIPTLRDNLPSACAKVQARLLKVHPA